MKTFKRTFKLVALILIIALASVLPIPITFYRKDNLPKYLIEQLDTRDDDNEDDDIKEVFWIFVFIKKIVEFCFSTTWKNINLLV